MDSSPEVITPGTDAPGAYLRPTPFETAICWMPGYVPGDPLPQEGRSPLRALEDAIRPLLVRAPCFVTFSGGRDSSAVLAVATDLARREGHALPVPVTRVYRGAEKADEAAWQEMVVQHLRLPDWVRLHLDAEDDLLGETARDGLRRRGLVWPPALQVQATTYAAMQPGGSVLTGEGGDEVLGPRRITPLNLLLRLRRRPTRHLLRWAGEALAPAPVRRAAVARELRRASDAPDWLRPSTLARLGRLIVEDMTAQPLRYDTATWSTTRKRAWAVLRHNQALVAAEHDLAVADPLLDRGFLAALATFGGRWGFAGRTSAMRALFAELLPAPVLARSTKAEFNEIYRGEGTVEFARHWDGSGVDPDLVEPEALRRAWLSDRPTSSTALLLQQAWLAGEGRRS